MSTFMLVTDQQTATKIFEHLDPNMFSLIETIEDLQVYIDQVTAFEPFGERQIPETILYGTDNQVPGITRLIEAIKPRMTRTTFVPLSNRRLLATTDNVAIIEGLLAA